MEFPRSTSPRDTTQQDRASLVNFGKVEVLTLCDGHGELGHDVAEVCCEAGSGKTWADRAPRSFLENEDINRRMTYKDVVGYSI